MLSTRRRIPQAERSLNSLALSVVAHMQGVTPPRRGHTGYLVGWTVSLLNADSQHSVKYHIKNLKKEHGESWRKMLHEKVNQLLTKLDYWLDDQKELNESNNPL